MTKVYGGDAANTPSISFDVLVFRDGDPEEWSFTARPNLSIATMKRAAGLQELANMQDIVEATGGLPPDMAEKLEDIYNIIEAMMVNKDGVKAGWQVDLLSPPQGAPQTVKAKVRLPHVKAPKDPSDTRTMGLSGTFNGALVDYDNDLVAQAQTMEAASSKRRWQLLRDDEEVELPMVTVAEIVSDLITAASGGRPLDESSSSSQPETTTA